MTSTIDSCTGLFDFEDDRNFEDISSIIHNIKRAQCVLHKYLIVEIPDNNAQDSHLHHANSKVIFSIPFDHQGIAQGDNHKK